MLTKSRTPNGDYVIRDGEKVVGFVRRSQRPTAKVGVVNFIAMDEADDLLAYRTLAVCDTLKDAIAVIEREMAK